MARETQDRKKLGRILDYILNVSIISYGKQGAKLWTGTAFHRANILVEQVLKDVRLVQDNMFEALDATQFGGEIKENDPHFNRRQAVSSLVFRLRF